MKKHKQTYTQKDIVLARVLHEDERSITLEILKDKDALIHLGQALPGGMNAPPDQFYTMLFTAGTPWELMGVELGEAAHG